MVRNKRTGNSEMGNYKAGVQEGFKTTQPSQLCDDLSRLAYKNANMFTTIHVIFD